VKEARITTDRPEENYLQLFRAVLPVTEHTEVLTDIHPFKWLSMKFVS
jgi:hypothetical protein